MRAPQLPDVCIIGGQERPGVRGESPFCPQPRNVSAVLLTEKRSEEKPEMPECPENPSKVSAQSLDSWEKPGYLCLAVQIDPLQPSAFLRL